MKKLLIVFLVLLTFGCASAGVTPEQIELLEQSAALEQWKQSRATSDGCSSPWYVAMWANIVTIRNWDDCCYQHDFDYGVGWKHGITRSIADQELHDCVWASGHPYVADLMWAAVRLFGWSHWEGGK